MRIELLSLFAVLHLFLGCASAQRSVDAQIRELTPGLQLTFEDVSGQSTAAYDVRRFSYSSPRVTDWPYGEGFAVWSRASGNVLWVYLHNGDFPPHEVRWADFDGDGKDDLFFHAGFEDVFETHLYVNRVSSPTYGVSQFAQTYENHDVYALVIDIDGDGQRELLVQENYLEEEDPCVWPFAEVAGAQAEWKEEYRRLTGSSPERHDELALFSKVRVISFGPDPDRQAVRAHLERRARILDSALPALSEPCRGRAAEVAAHVARLLRE